MRFASHRAVQGVGIGVLALSLALSLALTGCGKKDKNKKKNRNGSRSGHAAPAVPGGGSVSRTGLLTVDEVLPPAEAMPVTLRTVKTEEARSGKALKGCVPAGKCKGSVANGSVAWQSADKADSASFRVLVFKNASQATRAFTDWKYETTNKPDQYRAAPTANVAEQTYAYGYNPQYRSDGNAQTILLQQGKFIGIVESKGATSLDDRPSALAELSKMFAERMLQSAEGQDITANAAAVKLP
ncbi:hypothetical protein P8605_16660 [Streptomyces sp. T-3]|nr:hypothetical protein [Streptomyces sp. T-3]